MMIRLNQSRFKVMIIKNKKKIIIFKKIKKSLKNKENQNNINDQ